MLLTLPIDASSFVAVCVCTSMNRFVCQPSTLLWGPTRTRCTQYDLRTATIFTRFEHFPRTVAARRRGAGSAGLLCHLCGDVLSRALRCLLLFFSPPLSSMSYFRTSHQSRRGMQTPPSQAHHLWIVSCVVTDDVLTHNKKRQCH